MKELSKFVDSISRARNKTELIKFNNKRCNLLNACEEVNEGTTGILYWMSRDCRVQDNWGMLFAQRLAIKNQTSLHVIFFAECIHYTTTRHYKFLINGLTEVKKELDSLNINFYLVNNSAEGELLDIVKRCNFGALVYDFSPLKYYKEVQKTILANIPDTTPVIEVDSHNIVPCWKASDKEETAARTIRPKITKLLEEFLVEFPLVRKQDINSKKLTNIKTITFSEALNCFKPTHDVKMPEVSWAKSGYKHGITTLHKFLYERLDNYNKSRNDCSVDATSNLSPWLHFGQISAQRCALEAKKLTQTENTTSFLEELIIRRELTDNYCHYNLNYDNVAGAPNWARITLDEHRKDLRQYKYTREEFESGTTHDQLWNAAQLQLVTEGKMHGYMRMYWCKKVLEWTATPEEAVEIALYLNDTYSLDGCDPNGYVGVMWSICGVHDHGWKERAVFGKVRYMVDYSLARKCDADLYCKRYLDGQGYTMPSMAKKKKKVE